MKSCRASGTSSVHDMTMHSDISIKDNVFKRSHEARRDAHMPESYWTTVGYRHGVSIRRYYVDLINLLLVLD